MKHFESLVCLNGWWDYCPSAEATPPKQGWAESAYLVPSLVDKSLGGVRRKGSTYYEERLTEAPQDVCDGEHEFLFDNHQYPIEWMAESSGWARRRLQLDPLPSGKRRFLKLDAVAGRSEVWIDGLQISSHNDAFLPHEIDVSPWLAQGGEHWLEIRILDYERVGSKRKTLAPSGNMMTAFMRGIWQDVWLIERGEVYVADSILRCSWRKKRIYISSEVHNSSSETRQVLLKRDCAGWQKDQAPEAGPAELELAPQSIELSPGERSRVEQELAWEDVRPWQPESPHLYWLRSSLWEGEQLIDRHAERFGFREVWIEGPDFLLNGFPVHFFSDWGHKLNQLHHTEAWNRCWFDMMKRENLNHSRLHTHPHPERILDLADEEGIYITGESGLHGSGGDQAADEDAYWHAAREHIRAFVKRDKNHPSLLLWSVENEMRWNQDETDKTKEQLPQLYRLFRELDPSREAYHEGDSSLWNEQDQAIMSRHYGKECGGYGWWDKARPLHAGEMSAYHYMGPSTGFHIADDAVWADYSKVVEAAAQETRWIVEAGRSQGTAAFGPWNLSCLCNLRMHSESVTLQYEDWNSPGAKPRFIAPHSAEFEFWKEQLPAYSPFGEAHRIQAQAFRPFALIDLSHRRSYYAGKEIHRQLYLVNDSMSDQEGELLIRLRDEQLVLHEERRSLRIPRGRVLEQEFHLQLPLRDKATALRYELSFLNEAGEPLDQSEQLWRLSPARCQAELPPASRVLLIGEGPAREWLSELGLQPEYRPAFDAPLPEDLDLVILEQNSVIPESQQNRWVEAFLQQGGQVLLLEQKHSLFPGVRLESKPQQHGFLRGYGHPVLSGLQMNDVQFWGEDPYASMDSDAHMATRLYVKGEQCLLQPLVDAGEGGFGLRLPEWIALGEMQLGEGRLLASQFRMAEKGTQIPECRRLFSAMIAYLLHAAPLPGPSLLEAEAADPEALQAALAHAEQGALAWIRLRSPEESDRLSEAMGLQLRSEARLRYQAVRKEDLPVLRGISHADLSGIDGMTYCFNEESLPIADFALEAREGLRPLLVTPTRSYLEEQHLHGQRAEALRSHGASRFLFAEAPAEQVLLGELPYGKGQVIVDVFRADAHPRLKRFEALLRRNLGQATQFNALSGEQVPAAARISEGFPNKLCVQAVQNPEQRKAMQENSHLANERMAPTSMFQLGGWEVWEDPQGRWQAQGPQELALFCCFFSPRARRIIMEDSGIPNPNSLTLLQGELDSGEVELVLNGQSQGTQTAQQGRFRFSDLELVQGFNQMLLFWKAEEAGQPLQLIFRDIMQNAETELFFLEPLEDLRGWHQSEF